MSYKSRFGWLTRYEPGQYERIFGHPQAEKVGGVAVKDRRDGEGGAAPAGRNERKKEEGA